jgi:hypothetical protein
MPRRKRLIRPRQGQQTLGLVSAAPSEVVEAPRPGRPTKRSVEREQTILRLIARGNTRTAAAGAAGIDLRTLERWCKASVGFRRAVERAEHQAEVQYVERVHRASVQAEVVEHFDQRGNLLRRTTKYDPKQANWWLERRRPADWKPAPKQVEVSGDVTVEHGDVNVIVWRPDEAWLAALARNERDLPPDVRVVSPAPDRPVRGPVLLPEPVPATPAPSAAGDVPEPAERP